MTTTHKTKATRPSGTKGSLQAPTRKPAARKSAKAAGAAPAPARPADAVSDVHSETQRDVVNRLKRIEGQVRGLIDMVESGRSCEDVAQQMSAARKAMDKTFYRMMACTVMEAVALTDSEGDARREVERSTRILEKYA
ncbi:metal-sensitive transcriptional regulator [Hydrogenophaga sp. 5NK40-0174]|uniref:metal-sensitive transcriptional regulator n=1 Tax=Hydrogenophaga sp. 5NK40-0174 TaxID=3127649 RepID=UPI003108C160